MIGSAIIVVGLYSVLWGKYKEDQENKQLLEEIPEVIKPNNNTTNNNNGINVAGNIEEEKAAAVAIDLPIFTAPIKPT